MCKEIGQIPWLSILSQQDLQARNSGLPPIARLEQWLARKFGQIVIVLFVQQDRTALRWQRQKSRWMLHLHPGWLEATYEQWQSLILLLLRQQQMQGRLTLAPKKHISPHPLHPAQTLSDATTIGQSQRPPRAFQPMVQQSLRVDTKGSVPSHFVHGPHPLPTARTKGLTSQGQVHDLSAIFAQENGQHFDHRIQATISWGRATGRGNRARRSMQLGSYCCTTQHIRIHPCLDDDYVPLYFVRWVVFHEMLHQFYPPKWHRRRRQIHCPQFRAAERQHPDYEQASTWERQHLDWLLAWQPIPLI